mmetsp:Transcript_6739/g.15391  ORF Transcript_6739/g.15391 Transcript_6739/m.15391 type:complete len:106 (+) Transcript_6739:329-646(+)
MRLSGWYFGTKTHLQRHPHRKRESTHFLFVVKTQRMNGSSPSCFFFGREAKKNQGHVSPSLSTVYPDCLLHDYDYTTTTTNANPFSHKIPTYLEKSTLPIHDVMQ